jgi:hypothetical protein
MLGLPQQVCISPECFRYLWPLPSVLWQSLSGCSAFAGKSTLNPLIRDCNE